MFSLNLLFLFLVILDLLIWSSSVFSINRNKVPLISSNSILSASSQFPMNRDNLSVIFRAAYGNEYVRVGRFRPEDRCSPSRRRVAQEQIETQVHARAISCAGYSVASTKRSTCAFNPSESSYPFCLSL